MTDPGLDAPPGALADEVARRWSAYESDRRGSGRLHRRDASVVEILDGNRDAFERVRPPGSEDTLEAAQQRIVDGIQAILQNTGGHRPILRLVLETARRRAAARGPGAPMRILEVAAGSGWHLRHLWRLIRARGLEARLGASDLNPEIAHTLADRLVADGVPCQARGRRRP